MAHLFLANLECNSLDEFVDKDEANGAVVASNEQAKTGLYSLKCNITALGGTANTKTQHAEQAHTELYWRFYYYLPTATYNTLDVNWDQLFLLKMKDEDFAIRAQIDVTREGDGVVYLRYHYVIATDTMVCPSRDAWHCIELYHKRDGAAGAWQWWVDGVSQGSGAGINTGAKNMKYCTWGIDNSAGITGAVYLDNMIMATDRIYPLMGDIPQGNALRRRVESPQGWII